MTKIDNLIMDIENYKNLMFICLTETWCKYENIDSICIPDYKLSAKFCRSVYQRGGVGIWTRLGMDYKVINVDNFCSEKNFEVCAISFILNGKSYKLVNCYRSPLGDVNIFIENIFSSI